jgi:hypothetical protein
MSIQSILEQNTEAAYYAGHFINSPPPLVLPTQLDLVRFVGSNFTHQLFRDVELLRSLAAACNPALN